MGLLKPGINEVIATTTRNAAPIGVHFRDNRAYMILFRGSHTFENIERNGWVVANFVQDPVVYVRTAFEDLPPESFIDETIGDLKMQRLGGADAWAAFTATIERTCSESMVVALSLRKEIIEDLVFHPVNRGFGNIIDATVHATRYKGNRDPVLRHLIDHHAGIIRKCGGKRELEALDLLMRYIG
jgi:uncharacterized protein